MVIRHAKENELSIQKNLPEREELRAKELRTLSPSSASYLAEKEEERADEVEVWPCCVLRMAGCKEKIIQFRFMLSSPFWNPQT